MDGFIEILTSLLVITTIVYVIVTYNILRANQESVSFMREQTEISRKASTNLNILSILAYLQDDKIQKARRFVHVSKNLGVIEWDDLNDDEREIVGKVCSSYDILGIAVRNKIVPIEPFVHWGWSIRASRDKLNKYVEFLQSQPGRSEYWDDFLWLADEIPSVE